MRDALQEHQVIATVSGTLRHAADSCVAESRFIRLPTPSCTTANVPSAGTSRICRNFWAAGLLGCSTLAPSQLVTLQQSIESSDISARLVTVHSSDTND